MYLYYIYGPVLRLSTPPMGWGGGGSSPLGIHDPHCVPIYVTGVAKLGPRFGIQRSTSFNMFHPRNDRSFNMFHPRNDRW